MSIEHDQSVRPPRPKPAGPASSEAVPAELRAVDQWVAWQYLWVDGRWTKVPINANTGDLASSTDLATWSSFDVAYKAYKRDRHDGIGFVFAADGEYAGIDFDDCVERDGTIMVDALEHVMALNSYSEISPSGTGLKVFVRGRKPPGAGCRTKKVPWGGELEVYDDARYFTVTGQHVGGTPVFIVDRQNELKALCNRFWPPGPVAAVPQPPRPVSLSDQELLDRMFASASGEKIKRLWSGDTSDYGGDDSAADMALCAYLAFWCGRDKARMDSMFRASGLYRAKWERGDYRNGTLDKAISGCREVYTPREMSLGHRTGAGPKGPDADSRIDGPDADGGLIPLGERDPETGRLVLSPKRTMPTARAYVSEFHTRVDGTTLVGYADELMTWTGNRYAKVEDGAIKHRLQPWLHGALRYQRTRSGAVELVPFEGNAATINSALDSIRAYVHLPSATVPPCWLDRAAKRPPAGEIVPCRTLNLHVPTGKILPATPALFTTNALDFDPDRSAPPPELWLKFLDQLWDGDDESTQLLQEWFGYCLIADTSQQKMFLLVGPRRSGKGTIARVLRALVGEANVAAPTCASLAGVFGLQPLLGQTLAIISDARFRGDGASVVTERLLCISGEDQITVDRKFLPSVTTKLNVRFMVISNELPRLSDASTALAGRFLMPAKLTRSFYDKEDPGLTDKLLAERAGILNWSLEGWKRLRQRGHFAQPAAGRAAIEELESLSSPVTAFVRDCCETGVGRRVSLDELYTGWKNWCLREGRDQPGTKQSFGRDLSAAVPGIARRRGTGDIAFYEGIALAIFP